MVTEGILADFADEGRAQAQALYRHGDVGRRAAGFGLESAHVSQPATQLRREHVDQQFAQADDVDAHASGTSTHFCSADDFTAASSTCWQRSPSWKSG